MKKNVHVLVVPFRAVLAATAFAAAVSSAFAKAPVEASRRHGAVADVLDNVDPFVGTGGNGHTTPAATYPFGMVQPGPDTGLGGWERCSGYQYGDRRIERFSQTHLSGTGCGDFSDVGFMPFVGDIDAAHAQGYKASFDKANEKASPGYYAVTLDGGVKVEVTCTEHVALYRITYLRTPARLLYDQSWAHGRVAAADIYPMKDRRVSGHVGDRRGWPDRDYYFAWEISAEPVAERIVEHVGKGRIPKFVYSFDKLGNREEGTGNREEGRGNREEGRGVLYLKVSLSRSSAEGARRNIDAEVPGWDFDGVLKANQEKWRSILSRVEAKGPPERLKGLYTSIYHLCFQPNRLSDVGEEPLYSTFSCWDTYRAAGPLYTILTPEYVPAFINSMMWHFDKNGFLPVWALWGRDNQCMIGVHSVPMVVDAYLKGFGERGMGNGERIDWDKAWECVRTTLTQNRRRGKARYELIRKYGYYPSDLVKDESVSRLLEGCYDDACAARFAKALGKSGDAAYFFDRSRNWTNCFDSATGFIRGKDSKGAWRTDFDPYKVSHVSHCEYTEGNAFHWNWHVMQEPDLLVGLLGGKDAAVKRLEGLFGEDSSKSAGKLADVTGLIGQYCHGNEPSHHNIYFFSLLGRRDLAAKYVREVVDTQYYPSPTGLCGNDDCGQMSAWYVFACLGFYPFDPCGGEYVLGEAQLDEIKLRVGSGKFRVTREGEGERVLLNGRLVDGVKITHKDIMKGGTLAFVGGSAKYDYVFDSSAAPELDQWMKTKMAPAVRKWYPKLVEMFLSGDWKASKKLTFKFKDVSDYPAYTCGDVVTFSRKWINENPEDVGCGIHELFHVVQNDYPKGPDWLLEGIADYVRWYLYEPEAHGCDMKLDSDEVRYNSSYRVSANFLNFIETRHPGAVRELNALCRQGKYGEKTYWKKRIGKSVEDLEREWKDQPKQPFSYYRFCVDRTKSPTYCTQLSEFKLFDADGKVIPSGEFELGYDSSGGKDNFGEGETPECAVDGDLGTKWLDFRADSDANAARRSAVWIQFKFANPTKLSGYGWYTANDYAERDPRDWRLLGSNDGVNWVVVDMVQGFRATSRRNKLAYTARFSAAAPRRPTRSTRPTNPVNPVNPVKDQGKDMRDYGVL